MSTLKDVLCLLVIIFAYGIAGHLDYEDAVRQEEAQRPQRHSASTECWPTHTSPTGKPGARVGHVDRANDISSDLISGTSPDEINPCPPEIY